MIELSGSPRLQRLVAARSTAVARKLLRQHGAQVCVLLSSPTGPEALPGLPDAVRVVGVGDVLSHEAMSRVREQANAAAKEAAERGPWAPRFEYRGVHLGKLNRLDLAEHLLRFRTLHAAATSLLAESRHGTRMMILGGAPNFVRQFARESFAVAENVSTWSPRLAVAAKRALDRAAGLLGRFRTDGGSVLEERVTGDLPAPAQALFVVESTPMRGMFAAVMPHLKRLSPGDPFLTVDYCGEVAITASGSGEVRLKVPFPGFADFQNILGDHREASREDQSLGFEGISTHEEENPLLASVWKSILEKEIRRQQNHVDFVWRLLEEVRPRAVVVGNDRYWVGQAFVQVASSLGIPTLTVQDGVVAEPVGWAWAIADHVAANGSYLKRVLEDFGFPPEAISVTGQPRYDRFSGLDLDEIRTRTRHDLGISDEARLVLFPTEDQQSPTYVETVLSAILEVSDLSVLLRPHPAEGAALHRRLAKKAPERITVCPKQNIVDLVAASDVVVLEASTVALEAAALSRTVIAADFRRGTVSAHVLASARAVATTATELTAALRDWKKHVSGESPVPESSGHGNWIDFVGPLDGSASERVASIVMGMMTG